MNKTTEAKRSVRRYFFIGIIILGVVATGVAQPLKIDRNDLFNSDTSIPTLFLSANFKGINNKRALEERRPAHARLVLAENLVLTGNIELRARGSFRFENCDPPPLMLHFKTPDGGALTGLGKLKMVWSCNAGEGAEQLLLKEYLAYRIYNILTPLSFKVKRLQVEYRDSAKLNKWMKKNAFLLEDIDVLAKRNNCIELEDVRTVSKQIELSNYTMLAIFQYMIGNTDWGIPAYHNIKLVVPKGNEALPPFAIPYDLDYCGLVNAPYAIPNEMLPIYSVRQRVYMGVVNDPDEIAKTIGTFMEKKQEIMKLIHEMPGFTDRTRIEVLQFINEFYDIIENKKKAMEIFMNPPNINS